MQARYKIKIKQKLCRGPLVCEIRCVKSCPYNLLAYTQKQIPTSGEEPKEFKIIAAFPILCNNCRRCVEICPDKAIEVSAPKT